MVIRGESLVLPLFWKPNCLHVGKIKQAMVPYFRYDLKAWNDIPLLELFASLDGWVNPTDDRLQQRPIGRKLNNEMGPSILEKSIRLETQR